MRIYYPNLIDAYSEITGTSRASIDLSYENVAQEHPSKVWRTGATLADEYVTIDLGSAQAATAAIIFAHDIESADASAGAIELRKSTDNFAANDVLVGAFTFSTAAMVLTFSSASSRYWRVKFTKFDSAEVRNIGRIFLGNYIAIPVDGDGFKATPVSASSTDYSEGGQSYSTQRPQSRQFALDLNSLSQSEVALLKTFCETVDTHTCFFFVPDETLPSDEAGEVLYAKATRLPERKTAGFDSSGNLAWNGQLEAREQL